MEKNDGAPFLFVVLPGAAGLVLVPAMVEVVGNLQVSGEAPCTT